MPMIRLEWYLKDPCRMLSIPYYKYIRQPHPDHVNICHQQDAGDDVYPDTRRYFRLIHHLQDIPDTGHDKVNLRLVDPLTELPLVAEIINACYQDIQVDLGQVTNWTKEAVYRDSLWWMAEDRQSHKPMGLGIAVYDEMAREGALEWIQVLPAYKQQGVGRLLVGRLLDMLSDMADFVTVSGEMDHPDSPERLYRRCGFTGDDVWLVRRLDKKGS